jgi:hypothetical protein
MLASASFRVSSWLMQPWKTGHSTMTHPAGTCYMVTRRYLPRTWVSVTRIGNGVCGLGDYVFG